MAEKLSLWIIRDSQFLNKVSLSMSVAAGDVDDNITSVANLWGLLFPNVSARRWNRSSISQIYDIIDMISSLAST